MVNSKHFIIEFFWTKTCVTILISLSLIPQLIWASTHWNTWRVSRQNAPWESELTSTSMFLCPQASCSFDFLSKNLIFSPRAVILLMIQQESFMSIRDLMWATLWRAAVRAVSKQDYQRWSYSLAGSVSGWCLNNRLGNTLIYFLSNQRALEVLVGGFCFLWTEPG